MVEQLIRNQQVVGSSPIFSSRNPECESVRDFCFFILLSLLIKVIIMYGSIYVRKFIKTGKHYAL